MATTSHGEPDMVLISELLEDLTRNPPALGARKLLVEHYMSVGWLDAALENARELKRLDPRDQDVVEFLKVLEKKPEPPVIEKRTSVAQATKPTAETREWDPKTGRYKKKEMPDLPSKMTKTPTIKSSDDISIAQKDLAEGYAALKTKARHMLGDLLRLQNLQRKAGMDVSRNTVRIQAFVDGSKRPTGLRTGPPDSVRSVARNIRNNAENALDLIIADFESVLSWTCNPQGKASGATADIIRTALIKRKKALEAALTTDLQMHCEIALMHVEHEHDCLDRNYANTETMLMEDISEIPRNHFFVTEDNYAWDMKELVQAITANGGIFRNPLSRDMFTPKDVKGILIHPLGKTLSALAVEQREMSKGVRLSSIEHMEKLSQILLEDQSSDTIPSRKAVDEFLAYVATLPELEQKVIDGLKCPARDSHTGQSYDFTIGESVRDAKGNRVCFHKTGDFIKQAAAHLRQNQGVAPEPSQCRIM